MGDRKSEKKAVNQVECPFVSRRVVCYACGTSNFSIDAQAPPMKDYVVGRCDECGSTLGERK